MDFRFNKEEETLRQEVCRFAQEELPPGWLSLGEEYTTQVWPITQATARKLGQRGWLALGWPRKYGGQEAPFSHQLVFQEEAAYWSIPGTGMGVGGTAWVGPSIILFGSEEQKEEHLPRIASGEEFWCTAYSEPGTGSDLASLKCRGTRDGEDYIIDGQKVWTSAAHIAHWCWLLARTDPQVAKHRGLSLFMVDMKAPRVSVRPLINMAGLHYFNELYFDRVRVPKANRVGEENRGWHYVMAALDLERARPGIRAAGEAQRVLDELIGFVRNRDRLLPSSLQNRLAEMAVEIQVGRLLGYRVAHLLGQGTVPNYEASQVKVYGTELLQRLADLGTKLLGLYGQLDPDSPWAPLQGWVERFYLVTVGETIAAGTSEVQRNIMALRGLGLPRE